MKMKGTVKRHLLALALMLLLSIILRILWYHISIHPDEGEYGYTAMMWSRGYPLYLHREDMQPPIVYLLYLLAGNIESMRILNDTFFLVSVVVMFYLAKEVSGSVLGASVASAFYVIFMNAPALEGMFALPASLAVPFIVSSFYFGLIYSRKGQRVFLLLSGFLVSVAGLTYLKEAAFVLVLIFLIVKRGLSLGQGMINIVKDVGFLVSGMLVPLLVFTFYFAYHGIVSTFVAGVLRPFYFPRVFQGFPFVWSLLTVLEGLPLLVFSVGGAAVAMSKRHKYDVLLVFMLVLNYALDSVTFFGHYLLNIVVPSVLLSAFFFHHFLRIARQSMRKSLFPKLLLISIMLLSFPVSVYFQSQHYPSGSIQLDSFYWAISPLGSFQNQTLLATFLRNNTGQGEEVLVHGWMPEIYYLSGIQAPNPNLNTHHVGTTIPKEDYQTLLNMLIQQKFRYVVVAEWASWDEDSIALATRVYYREIDRIGRAELYERQSLCQLIKDSSFEDMSNWVITDASLATYTTAYAHSGNKSIAVTQSGNILSNLVYQDIPVKESTEYTLSAWSVNCPQNDIWFSIDEVDVNGRLIRHTNVGTVFLSLSEWSQTAYQFTTLNRTAQIRIYINILDVGTNYTVNFDDVNIFTTQP